MTVNYHDSDWYQPTEVTEIRQDSDSDNDRVRLIATARVVTETRL